jgi:mannose-1-phosphate guanylyltransferase
MNTHHNRYVVILAGGGGKRLWPLSRIHQPKQLLPFYGSMTLLEKTVERMEACAPKERRFVVTTAAYEHAIQKLVGNAIQNVIVEPVAKNTAPALVLSALEIAKIDPHALLICVPADHVIHNQEKFTQAIEAACSYAENHDELVLLGIKPDRPATEYGYLEVAPSNSSIHQVTRFHEKPTADVAQWYFQNEAMLWNSGIICVRASVLLQEIQTYIPELLAGIQTYDTLSSCSIDYALLEKTPHIAVVPADFGWSDIGSLSTFIAAYASKNQPTKSIDAPGAGDNQAIAKKTVVFAGVEQVCIIETDDMIFVTDARQLHRSAEIAEYLSHQGYQEYM